MSQGLLQVSADEALAKLQAGEAWLIDVREHREVAQAAFDAPNVVVVPLSEFEQRREELPRDKDLILACAAGGRSLQAVHYLMHHGYTRAINLQGGMGIWRACGLPVRQG